ncbi:MAG TPA: DUF4384 domain-containing protein [Pyrinomonadaceae bacterium]|jgi:hypothetical protein|nr:DUF4384 domain-containing protein [Pyrinomonadaceae bacterium]
MSYKSATMLAALALFSLAPALAQTGQQQQGQKQEQKQGQTEEQIIEGFVTTRGFGIVDVKPAAKPKPTPRTRRKPPAVAKNNKKKTTTPNGVGQGDGAASPDVAGQNDAPSVQTADGEDAVTTPGGAKIVNASAMPLQVGYTVYMKDSTNMLLPVPASKSFRAKDRIAITVETNADGYLYVFDAENGKDPVLIYPDARIDGGRNEMRAHVRETYPAELDDAFEFDATPAVEHLFIIVSRKPLADVPTGAALAKFCAKSPEPCEWRPTAEQWARIAAASLDSNVREARSRLLSQAKIEPVMPEMIARGIRVKKQAAPPAVVRVADTPGAKMLVTKIELLHK